MIQDKTKPEVEGAEDEGEWETWEDDEDFWMSEIDLT